MKELESFKVEGCANEFRIRRIAPTTLLALQVTLDLNDLTKTQSLMSFIFENLDVNINGEWINFKEKGREVYYPIGIEKNLNTLTLLATKFLNEYLKPLFMKSSE